MKSIDEAEVMSLFFPTFRNAVVIDTRHNDAEGPMVRIVSMVASPQERLRSIIPNPPMDRDGRREDSGRG